MVGIQHSEQANVALLLVLYNFRVLFFFLFRISAVYKHRLIRFTPQVKASIWFGK